jgi:hypothetical protein
MKQIIIAFLIFWVVVSICVFSIVTVISNVGGLKPLIATMWCGKKDCL